MKKVLILLVVGSALVGCGDSNPGDGYEIKGGPEVWSIYDEKSYEPEVAVPRTCASVGRSVKQVIAKDSDDRLTVVCGPPESANDTQATQPGEMPVYTP